MKHHVTTRQRTSTRFLAALILSLPFLIAAQVGQAAQYVISGSIDGETRFKVDDDLDIYVNGNLVYTDNSLPGSDGMRSPITINTQVGDMLRFVVRDTYGTCSMLSRLFLTDTAGRWVLADPGFDRGCGFPPGDQGIAHDISFPVPVLQDLPLFGSVGLPGSAFAGVTRGLDGMLYGVTYDGGLNDKGALYSFDPSIPLVTTLHSFDGAGNGSVPYSQMMLDPATGKMYGTTARGGPTNVGTIFEFNPATGQLVTLKSDFEGYYQPDGPLVKSGGFLYGVLNYTNGAAFRIGMDGTGFQIIHPFADFSSLPQALTLGTDGLLYGVTIYGGIACEANPAYGCGTIFRLKPVLPGDTNEQFEPLYQFQFMSLSHRNNHPQGKLTWGADGMLYGTTYYHVFKLDPLNPLTSFQFVSTDGRGTSLSVIEGADSRLYVADYDGGLCGAGAGRISSMTRGGNTVSEHHLFSFVVPPTSYGPYARLYRNAVGTLYGTTEYTINPPEYGTLFAISAANPSLDIDGNGEYDAYTDGVLIFRYLFGFRGDALTSGAIGPNPKRSTPADVLRYLDAIGSYLDVDGNCKLDASTDGLMVTRYLLGLRGSSLTTGAIASNATRSASQIEAYIEKLRP